MLTAKGYTTEDGERLCDRCSLLAISRDHSLAVIRVEKGVPCTCSTCGLKFRAQ